jgi:3-methylfumaryl-CoA hydratase
MSLPPLDLDLLKQWVGRSETREDLIHVAAVNAMAATLDKEQNLTAGAPLPLLWHWLFFWAVSPASGLGPDGHPKRGGFLPPVELPRRMWAGGRLKFDSDLPVASEAKRVSRIKAIDVKTGNSGRLAFVTVAHEIGAHGKVSIYEEHDIVYKSAPLENEVAAQPTPAAKLLVPELALWQREIVPDDVLLFRYSALTFNGHRIHYDRSYVTQHEGYPGLVVHGPLIATLLVDVLRRNTDRTLKKFEFKAVRPSFECADGRAIKLMAQTKDNSHVTLWAQDHEAYLTMQATAELN